MSHTPEASPIGAATALSDLIDVQPGGVVSRTLLKNPSGSLTLFAFGAGEGLSEHSTPHEAAVQVLEGRAEVRIGHEEHTVEAGEILHLPAGVPHALHAPEDFVMLLSMLRKPRE
jgi:quercetin dioxygenase-like cupin family protein